MIEIDYSKFGLCDELKIEQCGHILSSVEKAVEQNTFLGYFFNFENVQNLYTILNISSHQSADSLDMNIINRLYELKKNITWEIIPPYTEFENAVRNSFQQIEDLYRSDDMNKNELMTDLIKKTDKMINEGFIQLHLVDRGIRNDYFSLLNSVKRTLETESYFNVIAGGAAVKSLYSLSVENEKKFIKIYNAVNTKLEVSEKYYQKAKSFLDNKELKDFESQYLNIYKMMRSQNYDIIEEAIETIDMVDFRLAQAVKDKKENINNNLRKQIEKIRPFIWLEDWDILKSNIEHLIAESEEKGIAAELNLDKFHVDQKIIQKKEAIINHIKELEAKKPYGYLDISRKSRDFINKEIYLKDFTAFMSVPVSRSSAPAASKHQSDTVQLNKKINAAKIKYLIYASILIITAVVFFVNKKMNSDYFDDKGMKYIRIIETMVSKMPDKTNIDPVMIRKRFLAPEADLKIISVDNREIVIIYKGKTYKKTLPAERAKN